MSFTKHSDLDRSANMDVDDFIEAFNLNDRLSMAIKYLVRYSQHSETSAGRRNLERAVAELGAELKFNGMKHPSW